LYYFVVATVSEAGAVADVHVDTHFEVQKDCNRTFESASRFCPVVQFKSNIVDTGRQDKARFENYAPPATNKITYIILPLKQWFIWK
jgi:hypothetical protein